jgi:hypothetical protein
MGNFDVTWHITPYVTLILYEKACKIGITNSIHRFDSFYVGNFDVKWHIAHM